MWINVVNESENIEGSELRYKFELKYLREKKSKFDLVEGKICGTTKHCSEEKISLKTLATKPLKFVIASVSSSKTT